MEVEWPISINPAMTKAIIKPEYNETFIQYISTSWFIETSGYHIANLQSERLIKVEISFWNVHSTTASTFGWKSHKLQF